MILGSLEQKPGLLVFTDSNVCQPISVFYIFYLHTFY